MNSAKSIFRLPTNDIADCVLLIRRSCPVFYIHGCVDMKIAAGSISIHGHRICDEKWHRVCSSGLNLVTVECTLSRPLKRWNKLLSEILDNDVKTKLKTVFKDKNDVVCVVFFKANWLTSKLPFGDFFDVISVLDSVEFESDQKELHDVTCDLGFTLFHELPNSCSSLKIFPTWKKLSEMVQLHSNQADVQTPIVLICGGKNVGKSTFARYLMNDFLNNQSSLYFMETDVGQTEFTPPGILSLVKVNSPIFGPPFTHLAKSERALFFGDITPKDYPSTYVKMVYLLHEYYKESCSAEPLVINTCGWIKGLGVRILLDIIRLVQPTHIIQINSPSQATKNLPVFTEDFLTTQEGWTYESFSVPHLPHVLQIDAYENDCEARKGVQASDLRMLSLLSYFGMHQNVSSSFTLQEYIQNHAATYSIPISALKIQNIYDDVSPDNLWKSIIGSIVGLIRKNTEARKSHVESLGDEVRFGECVGLAHYNQHDRR
ncbi:polynucleotide 5'-hydroxyl-kinase NOL9-like isoform X2 [Xenia sp. Carnegie-2017]|uniref:polynucleotide 5'-hydroxyl-kinase NOL9-like isoform X2 n=1 Tax=Xenia sp. Carnegie-2017 TaxID=2897299 RepID=UPI001F04CFB3|nr:polynucleotide 5'-hydroxyl-kinase NOL9-like isoform X2 [Xenia sp. Carnegie-2017]